jgi:hypothetical protein
MSSGYGPRLTFLEKTEGEAKTNKPMSVFVKSTPKTRAIYEKNLLGAFGRSGLAPKLRSSGSAMKMPKLRSSGIIKGISKGLGKLNFKFSSKKGRKRRR